MLIEQEYKLFQQFLTARGKDVAPRAASLFVEALHSPQRERMEIMARIPSALESAVDELFDEYHLFLAFQHGALLKYQVTQPKP